MALDIGRKMLFFTVIFIVFAACGANSSGILGGSDQLQQHNILVISSSCQQENFSIGGVLSSIKAAASQQLEAEFNITVKDATMVAT